MNIKNGYYYLFYKFYKFGEWSPSTFPSDWTATLVIEVLEVLFIVSLKFYYIEYINPNSELTPLQMTLMGIPVFLINTFAFQINNKWKKYVKKFDKLPRYKNVIGTWITLLIVAFIVVNAAISTITISQIAAHRHNLITK